MKSFKTFGLAALVALMAMAFADASSALGETTALCLADEVPCSVANTVVHTHESSAGKATLLTSSLNTECDALLLAEALTALGAPAIFDGSYTYSNCTKNCTLTEENGPSILKILKTGTEKAELTYNQWLVHLVCSPFIDCRYDQEGLKGTVSGALISTQPNGETAFLDVTLHKESGVLCPKTAKLDIVTTPIGAVYVSR
jgi:hypothetical protein